MNTGSNQDSGRKSAELPAWADCDHFCIHDYAATDKLACGWRGRSKDATSDLSGLRLVCPRCGNATLLRIPLEDADSIRT